MDNDSNQLQDARSLGHEPIGTNVRTVWLTGMILTAVVVASFVLVAGLMRFLADVDSVAPGGFVEAQVPRARGMPELSVDQPAQRRELQARERNLLKSFGWVDRASGIAHIPIDQAMQILAAEGLPESTSPTIDRSKSAGDTQP